jgi:Helix-turn-helix domain
MITTQLALVPEQDSQPPPAVRKSQPLTFPELFGLPTAVDLATAARAIGIHLNTAYRLVKRGEFPCAVLRPGYRYRIPTTGLMRVLEIEQVPVYIDDADQGAVFAARSRRG